MKKKLHLLIIPIFILIIQGTAYTLISVGPPPPETIVLTLPDNSYAAWKEIARKVSENEGLVEHAPFNQTLVNLSELITIQYHSRTTWNRERASSVSLEELLDSIREATSFSYPGSKITWKIIEKSEHDSIYERILHGEGAIPTEHDIVRVFLTKFGLHRVVFTRKHTEMSPEEREKWIRLLKESATVVSFEEATHASEGFSMADRFKDSLDLGCVFQGWRIVNIIRLDIGHTLVCRISPSQTEAYITECLEVLTVPNWNPSLDPFLIDTLFETEKEALQEQLPQKVIFHILKRSPNEIIYSYSYPENQLQITGVVRSFTSDRGYYSVSYKHALTEEMRKEEILKWQEHLEAIKIRNP